jgi:hypothetical protein
MPRGSLGLPAGCKRIEAPDAAADAQQKSRRGRDAAAALSAQKRRSEKQNGRHCWRPFV